MRKRKIKSKEYYKIIRQLLKDDEIIRSTTYHCKDPNYNTLGITAKNLKKVYLKNGS